MNKLLHIIAALVLAGTATFSVGQPSTPTDAATRPVQTSATADAASTQTQRQMVAASSNASKLQTKHGNGQAAKTPAFAQLHPHGLPFSYYQGLSSR